MKARIDLTIQNNNLTAAQAAHNILEWLTKNGYQYNGSVKEVTQDGKINPEDPRNVDFDER